MKKTILFAVAAMLLSAPALVSQIPVTKLTVNEKDLRKKIEKSDADIANPKKNEKAATWLTRADLFFLVETAVTGSIWDGMKMEDAKERFGEPTGSEQIEVDGKPFTKYNYQYLDTYVNADNIVKAWDLKLVIDDKALDKAIEAYKKAHDFDAQKKNAEKISLGLQNCFDTLQKKGSQSYFFRNYQAAGDYFAQAYEVSLLPAFTSEERKANIPAMTHDIGISYLHAENYPKSVEYLTKAEELGYHQNGEIYCLIYHAYKKMAPNNEKEPLQKAKAALEKGFSKYPGNSQIVECLTDVYVTLGEDLNGIVPIIRASVEGDPDNAILWNGLGIIYERLGNFDESLKAFNRMVELKPNDFGANYSVGVLLVRRADKLNEEFNRTNHTGQAEYDAHRARVLKAYTAAIPSLEKAYENAPSDNMKATLDTVELLKNVTFLIRDFQPGMLQKFQKYEALYKKMTGN